MNYFLGLSGLGDSGKTETLTLLGNLMRNSTRWQWQNHLQKVIPHGHGIPDDLRDVFVDSKTKKCVSIVTNGDRRKDVRDGLTYMRKNKCDHHICACRSHGQTHDEIEAVPGFVTLYFPKNRLPRSNRAQQTRANNQVAMTLLQVFEQLIK